MHSKDGCQSHATYWCVILDSLARCLLAVAGAATPFSNTWVQNVCGQGRSAPNKTLSRCMVATCPLYQSVTTEVCHCAGTWVHCSSLALPAKVFILMHFHYFAACQLFLHLHVALCSANNCKTTWPTSRLQHVKKHDLQSATCKLMSVLSSLTEEVQHM